MTWDICLSENVAIVTMNTGSANCHNQRFFNDFHEAMDRLEKDFENLPVVITANGKIFSGGLDFEEAFPLFARASVNEVYAWFTQYRGVCLRLFRYPRPTIAAINGHAFGGGFVAALMCDYRLIANGGARVGLNEVAAGIPVPATYLELAAYAVGHRQAALAVLFGNPYSALQALDLGLVHQVVSPESLLGAAVATAKALAPEAMDAFAMSKRLLQTQVMQRVEEQAFTLDRQVVEYVTSPVSLRAQAKAYERLKGKAPSW